MSESTVKYAMSKKQHQKAKEGFARIVERFQRKLITEKVLAEQQRKNELQRKYMKFLESQKLKEEEKIKLECSTPRTRAKVVENYEEKRKKLEAAQAVAETARLRYGYLLLLC